MKNLYAWLLFACLSLSCPVFSLHLSNGDPKAPSGTINIYLDINPPVCKDQYPGTIHCVVGGTHPPFTYAWSTGQTTPVIPGTPLEFYMVTVTDAQGATATAEAYMPDASNPIVIDPATTEVSHYGENDGAISLTVCGGKPNYYYLWSNGNTTKDLNNLSAGIYFVTVIDANNCQTILPVPVNQPGPTGMTITAKSVTNASCNGDCGKIELESVPNHTYTWTGPNGFTTNTTNPVICYAGLYTVVATDVATGATAVKTFYIREKFQATLDGSFLSVQSSNPGFCDGSTPAFCEQLCPNTTVTYTAGKSNWNCNPLTYTWTVTGARSYSVSPSGDAVTVVWGEAGSGRIRLSAASDLFCEHYTEHCITILETPDAKFSTSPAPAVPGGNLVVCKDQPVWFANQSIGASRYEWQFGDDQSNTTEENPKHEFRTPGIFPVTLIARSLCFCADTATLMVEVLDSETPLVECVSTLCPGEAVTYSTPASCPSYQWTVSSNGQVVAGGGPADHSITIQWLSGPDGVLTLSTGNCGSAACPEPAVLRIPVLSDQAEIEGPDRICPNAEASYQVDAYDGTYYTWKLPAGGTILEGQGTPKVLVAWGNSAPAAGYPLIVD
ncbi:MAG: PKD domain-containing protein, partial [Thermoanaerobaculia bacterium]|nr:PKD domain-containing protein [Thermoanaerobaculia bacterium]